MVGLSCSISQREKKKGKINHHKTKQVEEKTHPRTRFWHPKNTLKEVKVQSDVINPFNTMFLKKT